MVNPADSLDDGQQVNVKELPQNTQPVPAGSPSVNSNTPQPSGGNNAGNNGAGNSNNGANNGGNSGKSKKGAPPKQK